MKRAVGHEIKCLMNLMRHELNLAEFDPQTTYMQGMFIGYLAHHRQKDQFQKDLETAFLIRRSTATGILQLMERDGLILREPVDYDARLKRLVLTEKAMQIFNRMNEELLRVEAKTTEGLTSEELDAFFALIDKMKHNLEKPKEDAADD